ncbi:MAG: hypothetical protein IPF58_01445 [Saprospirales bacterium]|nr:hypothetical protein [Saprospirales bacterium]
MIKTKYNYDLVHDISFELTGNDLIANLIESHTIRKSNPKFNKPVTTHNYKFGLFSETDMYGFQKLIVKMINRR